MVKRNAWTSEEFENVLTALKEKKALEEIATMYGRTVNAIKFKVYGYACDAVLKGNRVKEDIALELNLELDELTAELEKRTNPVSVETRPVTSTNPVYNGKKKPVVVVKKNKGNLDDIRNILAVVNSVQTLLTRYINANE
jgi:alpha-galactosidase/6-phospho-beta-glucosidase family protein